MNATDWSVVDDEPWPVYIAVTENDARLAVFLVAAALVAVLLLRRMIRD